jgi:integrase
VLAELAAHLAAYGPGPDGLVYATVLRAQVSHAKWSEVWRAAAGGCGIPLGDGYHLLRHVYASTLDAAGCSVKEVQERLGHASASTTLDTYSYLWPSSEERTREVANRARAAASSAACSPDVRQRDR